MRGRYAGPEPGGGPDPGGDPAQQGPPQPPQRGPAARSTLGPPCVPCRVRQAVLASGARQTGVYALRHSAPAYAQGRIRTAALKFCVCIRYVADLSWMSVFDVSVFGVSVFVLCAPPSAGAWLARSSALMGPTQGIRVRCAPASTAQARGAASACAVRALRHSGQL